MVQKTQDANQINVEMVGNVPFISHSAQYEVLMAKALAREHLTAQEKAAMAAEVQQMAEARKDPAKFMTQGNSGVVANEQISAKDTQPASTIAEATQNQKTPLPTIDERLQHAHQVFAKASPADLVVAESNLKGIQANLIAKPDMTTDTLKRVQTMAYIQQAETMEAKYAIAKNSDAATTETPKKDFPLTFEVANYSQARGKTMLNVDVNVATNTAATNYSADIHHGVNGKPVGLDLAEVNVGTSINDAGNATAQLGVRGVKLVHENGTHKVFVAGALDATATGIDSGNVNLGGSATLLGVNTHEVAGRPTSEIAGAVTDLKTGSTTLVASASQMFNAESQYATTARVVGTYGIDAQQYGAKFELYQNTGVEGLTARLNAGVNNIGGSNEPFVDAGVSFKW